MTSQPIASSRPAPSLQRRIRAAAATAAIAALIATGGYLITTGPDGAPLAPATATDVDPSAQTLRELHQSIAGQYGAADTVVNPSARVRRELNRSIARQYGSRPAPGTTVNPSGRVRRELHASIASQYGPPR